MHKEEFFKLFRVRIEKPGFEVKETKQTYENLIWVNKLQNIFFSKTSVLALEKVKYFSGYKQKMHNLEFFMLVKLESKKSL